jgi:competence protein ComEC
VLFVVIGADISYWYVNTHLISRFQITFIDVGQGDSILVEFPKGKRMLIDGGGVYDDSFDIGRNVVAPVLWRKKIMRLHYLVLTHPHPDHLNGLKFIASSFGVGEFWENGQRDSSVHSIKLREIIRRRGIKRLTVDDASAPRWINGAKVEVLNPSRSALSDREDPWSQTNDNSIVLKITYGTQQFLLSGDIEREAEARLLRSGKELKSDVLKVPHHGSRTSSTATFIAAISPSYAVFTVGYRNIFKLPNPKVLNRYENTGCRILRTDRNGSITFETNGQTLKVHTFLDYPGDKAAEQQMSLNGKNSSTY